MKTKFNFKSSPCTSIEQSERLLALGLKKETSDMMHYAYVYARGCFIEEHLREYHIKVKKDNVWEEISNEHRIPAWSLYRLIEMIPKDIIINSDVIFPFRGTALMDLTVNDCDLFEGLVQIIECGVKEGYFNKEYLV